MIDYSSENHKCLFLYLRVSFLNLSIKINENDSAVMIFSRGLITFPLFRKVLFGLSMIVFNSPVSIKMALFSFLFMIAITCINLDFCNVLSFSISNIPTGISIHDFPPRLFLLDRYVFEHTFFNQNLYVIIVFCFLTLLLFFSLFC